MHDIEQQCVGERVSDDAISPAGAKSSPTVHNTPTQTQELVALTATTNSQDEENVSALPTWWSDSISTEPSWKTKPVTSTASEATSSITAVSPKQHEDDQQTAGPSGLPAVIDDSDHDVETARSDLQEIRTTIEPAVDSVPIAAKEKLAISANVAAARENSSVPLTPPLPPSHISKVKSEVTVTTGSRSDLLAMSNTTPIPEAEMNDGSSNLESTIISKSNTAKALQGPSVSFADANNDIPSIATEDMKKEASKPVHAASASAHVALDSPGHQPPKPSKSMQSPPVGKQHAVPTMMGSVQASVPNPSMASTTAPGSGSSRLRIYKSSNSNNVKWVTREIAALDFLLGIPMEAEEEIVHRGWMQQHGLLQSTKNSRAIGRGGRQEEKTEILEPPANSAVPTASSHGRWWEKWISNTTPSGVNSKDSRGQEEGEELEQPNEVSDSNQAAEVSARHQPQVSMLHAPGRRLDGDQATLVQVPLGDDTVVTRQRSIARQAVIREWELRVAHGIGSAKKLSHQSQHQSQQPSHQTSLGGPANNAKPMLDGRMFFSASGSYPMGVYSLIRYEPKKEEAIRMRKRLEALGGGGTQFFVMPERDWRGISYRALLISYDGDTDKDEDDGSADNLNSGKKRRRKMKKESFSPSSSTSALSPDPKLFDRFATSSISRETSITASNSNNSKDNSGDENEDNASVASISSDEHDEDDTYTAGLLDDPDMVRRCIIANGGSMGQQRVQPHTDLEFLTLYTIHRYKDGIALL